MIRIAVDAMGGDYAPDAVVNGAITVAKANANVEIILVGQLDKLPKAEDLPKNIVLEEAKTVMAMDESVENLRKKRDSSIWVATKMVKDGKADAIVSAGSTGAQMASSLLLLGRVKGITRPAIGCILPNGKGGVMLLDTGANVEISAEQYLQFAYMGVVAGEYILKKPNPRIALLSNGTEEHKGTDAVVEAHQLLKNADINFVGNIEARSVITDEMDVIVTDGFTGNVLLKSCEGVAKSIMDLMKIEFKSSFRSTLGALLVKPALMRLKKMMDYKEVGGSPLLGVNGVSVVCHGSSDARAIEQAIKVAIRLHEEKFIDALKAKTATLVKEEA